MLVRTVSLFTDYKAHGVSAPKQAASLTEYVLPAYGDVRNILRPAILICPGGAYAWVSEREGEPVASVFNAAGYNAYVLNYTVAKNGSFPCALMEAYEAIRYIRSNAKSQQTDPDRVWICGFSAGGHLAASTGILWKHPFTEELGYSKKEYRPDGMILGYPVISAGTYGHKDSFRNLLGERYCDELLSMNSLEQQVNGAVPPTFLWHTAADKSVPVQNTLLLADALTKNGVETEVHIYPRGAHGLSTARYDVLSPGRFDNDPYIKNSVSTWTQDAIRFIRADR